MGCGRLNLSKRLGGGGGGGGVKGSEAVIVCGPTVSSCIHIIVTHSKSVASLSFDRSVNS